MSASYAIANIAALINAASIVRMDALLDQEDPTRAGQAATRAIMRYGAKKDANHKEVMGAVQALCGAYDLSAFGFGLPDGIAWVDGAWRLFDIKNPKTAYGRRGLNDVQKRWISKWQGGPVYLLHSAEEAIKFASGKFEGLKFEQSGWGMAQEAANEASR